MANQKKPKTYDKRYITRRDFLKAGGAVIASAVLFDSLAACTSGTSSITAPAIITDTTTTNLTPKYGGTVKTIWIPAEANLGWPLEFPMGSSSSVVSQVSLESLLRGDNKGNTIPWLAESYKVADDLKSISFTLRKGVKFHDGSDFNAEVAKWNLDNYINAKMQPTWSSVDIIDDYAIRVNFVQWSNLTLFSFGDNSQMVFMVSKASFDKNGIDWMRRNPVGTGPFKFISHSQDTNCIFQKNLEYWKKDAQGNSLPYLDEVQYLFISDPVTRKLSLQAGEADASMIQSNKQAADYAGLGLTVKAVMFMNQVLVPDTANADSPWANQKVREAVEYAIDREAIAKAFGYGYCQAIYQIPARYSLAYNPDFALGRKYDVDKARQLLAETDYPNGFKTTIIVSPGVEKDVPEALQSYLAKVGIQADLNFADLGVFSTYLGPGTWPKNSALYNPLPAIDIYFLGGLQFAFNNIGQSWLRTPAMVQAYQDALSSVAPDITKIRAVTDISTKDASLIPIIESSAGVAIGKYVMNSGWAERGNQTWWNAESAWLNK